MESLIEAKQPDAVHILVPPDKHHLLAKLALEAGVNVFLEKPMCTSVEEADELLAMATTRGLRLGVNHNLLFAGAYQRLRQVMQSGAVGPTDYFGFNHFVELGQIRFGPFDAWMLRDPGNVILEIGPHLLSVLLDLVGKPDEFSVSADRAVTLPGGGRVFRRWRIHTTVGRTAVDVNINLGPGFSQRSLSIRSLFGSAALDFDANTCAIDQRTPHDLDMDRYWRSRSQAHQIRSQARATLADYLLSRLKLRKRGNPYQVSIFDSVAAFYSSLQTDTPLDRRVGGDFGRDIIACCTKIIGAANIAPAAAPVPRPRASAKLEPNVLVIGGAGFIGRELIRQLLNAGYSVRAMMRGAGAVLEELGDDRLEIFRGDARNATALAKALQGVAFVYDLATAETKTWDASLRNVVEPARLIGNACLAAKVKRLVYTGTINSYYAGAKAGTITERTPLDPNIARRNYYARGKAAAETILMDLHKSQGLPVVIFRPGIVIGRGGNPFHWGVGRFSENVCEVWGDGTNKLPLVLVADVAAGLLQGIEAPAIEGGSYNLVDVPLLSARDYLTELQKRAGIKLTVHYQAIWKLYGADLVKWSVKLLVRHPDSIRIPSYRDWESRTQKAVFDCARARVELWWEPASNRERLIAEGIGGSLEAWLKAIG